MKTTFKPTLVLEMDLMKSLLSDFKLLQKVVNEVDISLSCFLGINSLEIVSGSFSSAKLEIIKNPASIKTLASCILYSLSSVMLAVCARNWNKRILEINAK